MARNTFSPRVRTTADASLLVFCVLAVGASFGPFFLPNTPVFGGYKHWLQAYPFAAILAGRGASVAIDGLAVRVRTPFRNGARVVGVVLAVLGPAMVTVHAHPFGIAPYVPAIGGMRGGARLGLNRQFWGYTTQNVASVLAELPPHGRVFVHDTAWDAWVALQAEGRVRADLQATFTPQDADMALVQHELHMNEVDHSIWVAFDTASPVAVLTHDGVPYVSVYRRRR